MSKKFTLPAGTTNRHQWHKATTEALQILSRCKYETKTLTGIKGVDERSHTSQILFGGVVNETANALYNDIGDAFDWNITRENADQITQAVNEAIEKAQAAIPVEDERKTPEQIDEQKAKFLELEKEREEASQTKAQEVRKFEAELRQSYPWAIASDDNLSGQARAAKNLKNELKIAFPLVNFSVRSESFSMGNAIRVSWSNGPTGEEVDNIAKKYQYGNFNGMEDIYEHDSSAKGEAIDRVLGRSKYVSTSRTVSKEITEAVGRELCKQHGEEYSENGSISGQYISQLVWRITCRASIPHGATFKELELVNSDYVARFNEPEKTTVQASSGGQSSSGIQAHREDHLHTKKGFTMYMVVLDMSLDRDEFNEVRSQAKSAGGWYSRKWGATPCGFAFEQVEQADQFLTDITGNTPTDEPPKPTKGKADKFRDLADKLTPQIEGKLADRLTNTPKRLKQANHARLEGEQLKRTQEALYKLADLCEMGTVPTVLSHINSKAQIYNLMGTKKTHVPNGFHEYSVCTGEPTDTDPVAKALWSLVTGKTEEDKQAEELQRKVDGLKFSKIAGYFPTPNEVINTMLDYANIKETDRVLEPNLGSCAIADRVAPLCAEVKGFEINHTLAEIGEAKDYLIHRQDFLTVDTKEITSYEKILMNPPFENLQDVDHVLHAFKFLKEGGRLVSVMSPSAFYRDDKKSRYFRSFVDTHGGETIDLPPGSFKESGTSINTCLLILDKD